MSKERSRPFNAQINHEAADWFVELNTAEPDDQTRRDFDKWLRTSPEHVRAYLDMMPIWDDARSIDSARRDSIDQLIDLARQDTNIVSLQKSSRVQGTSGAPSVRQRAWLAIAATILMAAVGLGTWFYAQRGTYRTAIGEQRTISLPDGSTIELNARSAVRIRYRELEREVRLLEGQALFKVTHNAQRPFVVSVDHARVRAVGTQFDVYRRDHTTTVTVIEGRVAVTAPGPMSGSAPASGTADTGAAKGSPGDIVLRAPASRRESVGPVPPSDSEILLSAGQQLTVTPTTVSPPIATNTETATSWTQQHLVFSSTPLPEVAEEFNRYNARQIKIECAALASPPPSDTKPGEARAGCLSDFKVSGIFSLTDLPSLLRFLRAQPNMSIDERGDEIRVSAK